MKHTEEDWMSLQEGSTITVVQHHEEGESGIYWRTYLRTIGVLFSI